MTPFVDTTIADFEKNQEAVLRLLEFDAMVMQVAIQMVRKTEERNQKAWEKMLQVKGHLKPKDEHELPDRVSLGKVITFLENIRTHESLKRQYDLIVNQCLVLLAAHFASATRNLLRGALEEALQLGNSRAAMHFEVKARAADLQSRDRPMHVFIADTILSGSDFSFQDMKSIGRGFKTYFDFDIPRDDIVNDLIVAHAARHVIAHSGETADSRFINQVRDANPRRLLKGIVEGQQLGLEPDDVRHVAAVMRTYLENVGEQLSRALARPPLGD